MSTESSTRPVPATGLRPSATPTSTAWHRPGRDSACDTDDSGADPVGRPGAAVPDPGRDGVLLRLRGQVRRRSAAAEELPGGRHDLVVAGGARAVGRQILA